MSTYNGVRWSHPSAIPFDLVAMSCVSASFCAAIDRGHGVSFNGKSWSTPTLIDAAAASAAGSQGDESPYAISCASPRFCMALEGDDNALIMFNGSRWSRSAGPQGFTALTLSCASSSFCLAIGVGPGDISNQSYVFDGTAWSKAQPAPTTLEGSLLSVSCVSPTFCMAVGGYDSAAAFNGSTWSAAMGPVGNSAAQLTSVSCASSTFCVTVGGPSTNSDGFDDLAYIFNGRSWSPATHALSGVSGYEGSGFSQVSCSGSAFFAVTSPTGAVATYRDLKSSG